ncbi:TetR family transcriptional regulator [Leptospira semungkisensis]|uniref:TetR family transcriptional regulator n=1 Tax=Leptospira semungkisensis TaxID=2484985 RepID=A0A4R9FQL3_9LEPT|nr:TetR/AcrR family transcriptional regulator [Leptospira semungkisensis]TGK00988.1 TetR family transcriptional regulator [Leptospira semungkisensis]
MRISQSDVIAQKEHILEVGTNLIRSLGFTGAGVAQICQAASIPKGSFYNYFPGKSEFAIEALELYSKDALAECHKYLDNKELSPKERILQMFKNRIDSEKKLLKKNISCLGNMLGQNVLNDDKQIIEGLRKLYNGMSSILADTLSEIYDSKNARTWAAFLEQSWRGAMLAARATHSTQPLDIFIQTLGKILDEGEF